MCFTLSFVHISVLSFVLLLSRGCERAEIGRPHYNARVPRLRGGAPAGDRSWGIYKVTTVAVASAESLPWTFGPLHTVGYKGHTHTIMRRGWVAGCHLGG